MFLPVVHSGDCTGCGICENACPTQIAAIRVRPAHLIQGKIGDHYRLGWKHVSGAAETPQTPDNLEGRTDAAPGVGEVPGLDYLNRQDF